MVDTGGAQRHPVDTQRLMEYWAHGEDAPLDLGRAPGDFDRCVVQLSKYVSPGIVKGLCSNLHQRATGARPGHAAGETDGHGHKH